MTLYNCTMADGHGSPKQGRKSNQNKGPHLGSRYRYIIPGSDRLDLNTHQKNDKVGDRGAARLASALEKNEAWQRCVRGYCNYLENIPFRPIPSSMAYLPTFGCF